MSFRWLLAAALLWITPCLAHAQFQDAPPEIQQLLEKVRHGQKLTPAERDQMKAWAQQRALGGGTLTAPRPPAAKPPDPGAPCVITMITDATVTTTGAQGSTTRQLHFSTSAACRVTVSDAGPGNFDAPLLLRGATTVYKFVPDPDPRARPAWAQATAKLTLNNGAATRTCEESTSWSYPSARAPLNLTLENFDHGDLLFPMGGLGADAQGVTAHRLRCDRPLHYSSLSVPNAELPDPVENLQARALISGKTAPALAMKLSIRALDAAASGAADAVVVGNEDFDFTPPDDPRSRIKGHGQLQITMRMGEIFIEPVDPRAYASWIPAPPDPTYAEDGRVGVPLQLRAFFRNGTAAPMALDLEQVSQNLGVTTNAPAHAEVVPGLRFADKQPDGVHRRDDQHVDTDGAPVTELVVAVEARDTGAYGKLRATSSKIGAEATRAIPLDDNGNDIADAWEKKWNIFEKNLPANWDGEDTPKGPNTGDGLTLYEEYRGMLLNSDGKAERFRRFEPGPKKVFFLVDASEVKNPLGPDIVPAVLRGIAAHEKASRARTVVVRAKADLEAVPQGSGVKYRVNPNSSVGDAKHFGKEHHAVHITAGLYTEREAVDVPRDRFRARTSDLNGQHPSSPDDGATIALHPDESALAFKDFIGLFTQMEQPADNFKWTRAWLAARGKTAKQMVELLSDPRVRQDLVDKDMTFTVIHEAGHAIGRHHHENPGAPDPEAPSDAQRFEKPWDPPATCPMHYYDHDPIAKFELMIGRWDPGASAFTWQQPAQPDQLAEALRTIQFPSYSFCDGDDGRTQGGSGAPRYHP